MTTEIATRDVSLRVVKIDFNFILDNFYKKALWDKTWPVFQYKDMKVELEIYSIDVRDRKVTFRIRTIIGGRYDTELRSVSFQPEHRNLKVIHTRIYSAVMESIAFTERQLIRNEAVYQRAADLEEDHKRLVEDLATEKLDALGITDEDIREAYIDACISNNSIDKTSEVMASLEYTMLYEYRLSFTAFSQNRKTYNSLASKIAKAVEGLEDSLIDLEASIQETLDFLEVEDMDKLELEFNAIGVEVE